MKLSLALEIMGLLMFLVGIWWVWPPGALIFGGALVILGAQFIGKKGASR